MVWMGLVAFLSTLVLSSWLIFSKRVASWSSYDIPTFLRGGLTVDYRIDFSPSYSLLTVELEPGESVLAEPGAMVAQQDVELCTRVRGGPLEGLQRVMGGESFWLNRFTGAPGAAG